MSGIMSITGAPENAPYRVGYPVADTIGGITAAFAVAAALADRNRGEGVFIDVSMLEAAMATMGWAVSNHLIAGREPQPLGNDNVTASPSGTFRTGDGLLNIAANKQEQFEAVCRVLGQPEWAQDPRFADRHARLQHRDELKALIEAGDGREAGRRMVALLNEAGVPAGPVYYGAAGAGAPADRRVAAWWPRSRTRPGWAATSVSSAPASSSTARRPRWTRRRPLLGQHTDEILAELGYADERESRGR